MCQTHLYMLQHPQGYIYNPPKPSFDKEGFRGHEPISPTDKKQASPKGNACFS